MCPPEDIHKNTFKKYIKFTMTNSQDFLLLYYSYFMLSNCDKGVN